MNTENLFCNISLYFGVKILLVKSPVNIAVIANTGILLHTKLT